MRALVINLARSRERMDFQAGQLQGLGIEYERVEAIDAKQLDPNTYAENAYHWERPLRDTEVACCLSHAAAWEQVQKLKKPCLILEDDALLCNQTKVILEALEKKTQYDCVNLETRGRTKFVSKEKETLTDRFKTSKLIQDKSGAAAYVLFPSGAEILLEKLRIKGAGLADALIATTYHWKHGQLEPAAAIQLDCCEHYRIMNPLNTESGITSSDKPQAKNPFLFRWRRSVSQLSIAFRKLSFLRTAESIQIEPYHIKNSEVRKTIALVINDLKGNGAERVVITLASAFIEAGHQASIICFKKHIELPIPKSIPVFIFSEKRFRWIPRRLRGILTAPVLDRFIIKHAGIPDLVLSSLLPSDRILAYSKLPGVHFIIQNTTQIEVTSDNPKKKHHEIAQRLKLYQRKPCICVSKGVEKDLRDMLAPIALPPITTIYNSVEVEKIRAAANETPSDIIPNAIICVGKFKKQKRQDRLIRAYHAADCPYPLVFIGQGPLLPEARNLVDELKLNDRVHFMGFRKNPYPYIKAARLHVLCSDYEGLGVVILEALCLKTPTISSDCPSGPSEILPPENLFETDDMGAFVQLLKNASLSPELFQASLSEEFCSHYAARKYLNLFR